MVGGAAEEKHIRPEYRRGMFPLHFVSGALHDPRPFAHLAHRLRGGLELWVVIFVDGMAVERSGPIQQHVGGGILHVATDVADRGRGGG